MDPKEISVSNEWKELTHDRDHGKVLVNAILNVLKP